jgi:ketosteroid isomerase-like protein
MSSENVALVRSGYEAFNRDGWEAIVEFLTPDVVWDEAGLFPDRDSFHGHDGIRELARQNEELWEGLRVEVDDVIPVGEDKVVVLLRTIARGQGSGVEVDFTFAHLWTIRDGKGCRVEPFSDREAALRAAGTPDSR